MAMEALYRFIDEGRYDLIVLDTPPSRNALDFLLGPGRMAAFLEGRVFQLFLPAEKQGFFRAAAGSVITRINGAIFGEETYAEMQEFFGSFSGILMSINKNASSMLAKMQDPDQVAFLLVSSPAAEALTEAFFFRKKTVEMGLPFRGFILNRTEAFDDGRLMPTASLFDHEPLSEVERSALMKLDRLAHLERAQVERDRALLAQLRSEVGDDAFAIPLPTLATGAHEMPALMQIADALMMSKAD
jgi:anion-transporting  ArsA/GET3 family ATPase